MVQLVEQFHVETTFFQEEKEVVSNNFHYKLNLCHLKILIISSTLETSCYLMYNMKSNGPSTEPWGAPQVNFLSWDLNSDGGREKTDRHAAVKHHTA